MKRLKTIAVFEKADSCMEMMGMTTDDDCPMGCCQDVEEEMKVDDLNKTTFEFNAQTTLEFVAIASYIINSIDLVDGNDIITHYSNYSPPLIERDILADVQVMII
ncbi:MAG: hypothetical protein RJQ09_07840 [Cyclobacteriaceae bacterium]